MQIPLAGVILDLAFISNRATIRCSPGGKELSQEALNAIALLLIQTVPHPDVQTPTDFEIEQFLRDYDNPRGLSKKWLEGYLGRPKPRLAIDIIRAFDSHFKIERSLRRTKLVLGILNAFLGVVTATLALLHFVK